MPKANRKTLPGYPRDFKFETRAQLDEYLSGERIVCLLCGQTYRLLDTHLRNVHGITSGDYRDKYGIGRSVGLQSAGKKMLAETAMKDFLDRNPDVAEEKKRVLANSPCPRPNNMPKPVYWRRERTVNSKDVWFEVGRRMIDGEILIDACEGAGVTHYTLLYAARKRWADLDKWFAENVDPVKLDGTGMRKGMAR